MSNDVARLGLAIDSSQVTTANTALDKFQASANAAAAGADKLQAATKTTGANVAVIGKSAQQADKALQDVAKSTGLARHEMINLSRQLQDVGVSLASGQSPFMVLAQQGTQIADIFGSSKNATVGGALRQIGSTITGVLTPMRLLGGGAALIATGFAVAANSIIKSELALDDFSRATDLSLTKIHALQQSASFKGIGNDDFQKGIASFAESVNDAQHNFGTLNGLMIANGKSAKDLQGYLGNVADIVARSGSDVEKMKILREAGLPSDAAWVRYMEQGSKGIQSAIDGTVKFNESAELNLIRKAREFDDAWNKATTNIVNYFKSGVVDITSALSNVKVPDWLKNVGDLALRLNPLTAGVYNLAKTAAGAMSGGDDKFADRYGTFQQPLVSMTRGLNQRAGIVEPKTLQQSLVENQQAQQRIALLGNLATVQDQVRQKQLELDAANLQGVGVSDKQAAAILNVVRAQAEMQRTQEQASIGIYRNADAIKAMNDNLQSLVDRGLVDPKNLNDFAAALNYSAKAMEDLNDQAKVAGSALPQFQQALNDAGNARKQLDGLATEAVNVNRGFFVEFGQQIRQGANAWDSFRSAGLNALGKIADKLTGIAADSLFSKAFGGSTGGLASLFGFGGTPIMSSPGDLGGGTGGLSFPMFANGGTLRGGWGVVGERGPELINVHNGGATIIPNHVSKPFLPGFADGGSLDSNGGVRRMGFGQGGGVTINAGDTHISIEGNADEKTVALMRAELARDRAARYADTVKIVQSAKKRREL